VPRDVPDRFLRRPGDRSPAAAVCLAVVVVAIAGCGGDGGEATSTPVSKEDKAGRTDSNAAARRGLDHVRAGGSADLIRLEVKGVLTSISPAVCSPALVTKHYLETSYGGHQGCVKALNAGSVADHVDFKELTIEGRQATAVVVPSGGLYDGERLTVSLVRDPHWAVDSLRADVPVGP
jgi:hypothetical protein